VYISSEVDLNSKAPSFGIAGGIPGLKVCWAVKAVRNDLWVQKYGAPIEEDKAADDRGTYQQPELYGQPSEKQTTRRAMPKLAQDISIARP